MKKAIIILAYLFINTKTTHAMTHELPKLPYALDALAPTITKQTMEFHYGKHLQTYINNLNNLIKGTKYEDMDLEEIVKKSHSTIFNSSDTPIFNNAAQAWNHAFYFLSLKPNGGGEPTGKLAAAIFETWGSFAEFKKEFTDQTVKIFGSGWAWLVMNKHGKLSIVTESNAGNPMTSNYIPLLTFDVWEHAYYLDYQNRRADHVKAIWNIIDWDVIAERLEKGGRTNIL